MVTFIQLIENDDYRWPEGTLKLSAMQCRAEQLTQRVSEVSNAVAALRQLFGTSSASSSSSNGFEGSLQNLRPASVDLQQARGAVDTDDGQIIMAGHSFGSATALQVLRDPGEKATFGKGICLDPVSDSLLAADK